MELPTAATSTATTRFSWASCSLLATGQYPGYPMEPFDPAICPSLAAAMGLDWGPDPEGWDPYGWVLAGTISDEPTVTDPDLAPPYADHLVLAVESALRPRTSLELSWVSKRSHDLMEDTCNGMLDGLPPGQGDFCSYYVISNLTGLERSYDAAILRLESRELDWLNLLASYTWSASTGNIESLLNSYDFDYPSYSVNRDGYLSDQRRHRLRINGFALLPWDTTIAFNGGWSSAFRWTPYEDGGPYPAPIFVEPRGSRHGDNEWWLDLELNKGFTIGSVRLVAILSAFNVFSTEQVTGVCARVTGCGGDIELGDAIAWQYPRRWEVGLRVEF